MKKKIFPLLLIITMLFGITTLFACKKEYTEQEIILETKSYIKETFNNKYLYNFSDLPKNYSFENKYKTYIEWESSDLTIVDTISEGIYKSPNEQTCILTAIIYYGNISGTVKISIIIPKMENPYDGIDDWLNK